MIDLPADTQIRIETLADAFNADISEIALPPTATNTLFVIEHLDDASWPVPTEDSDCRPAICAERLVSNDTPDETWFDRTQLTAASGPINPITIGEHVHPLGVLVPSGPRAESSTTGYTLTVETKNPGRTRLTSLSRTPRAGRLDLNLYYVGSNADREVIEDALAEVDRIFEPAEIFIGELRHIEVTGALLEQGSELPGAEVSRGFAELKLQYGVYPQLPELFKLSAGAGNSALDVFFVADITGAQGGSVGGLAGGTPVPFGMHGTGASGLAIATDPWADDPELLGRTLAHELGHALGLFHTVERNGQVFDPLPDTPACERSRDRDANGLDANDCEGAGADNLMFPTANATASQLTPDQAAVLRRAMVLR